MARADAGRSARRGAAALLLSWLALGAASAQAGPVASAAPVASVAAVGPASVTTPLQLVLPLAADERGLEAFARAVSTPGSPSYGQYESIAALSRRFGASPAAGARVLHYLRRAGARGVRLDATRLFVDATMSAGLAERLFGTSLTRFRARAAQFVAPTARARIPLALRGAVTGVVGLDTQPLGASVAQADGAVRRAAASAHAAGGIPSSAQTRTGSAGGCPEGAGAGEMGGDPATAGFTPNQYLTAYGLQALQGGGLTGQGERAALIEIDGFAPSDIQTFATCFGFTPPPIHSFGVGIKRPLAPGGEATLDLEVLTAAAPGLSGIDVYETRSNASNTLRALTAPLQNRGFHPQVISASLGLCEPFMAGAVGIHGLRAAEGALAMAAASGITFLASTGDKGSADCTTPDGTPLDRLAVNYPASSPWVTAVGGTNLTLNSDNSIASQVVWNDTNLQPGSAAGGGLSRLFRRPYYQDHFNGFGRRGIPDISMLADIVPGYAVYCSARPDCVNSNSPTAWQTVGGTSAATPLLAGGLTLVDEYLAQHQRQSLGLANPLLYAIAGSSLGSQVFSDVVEWGNDVGPYIPGNRRPLGCCSAHPGYDLASGLGSVNLLALALPAVAAQPPFIALSVPRRQRPLRRREILASVSCAAACQVGAFAKVFSGRRRLFTADSRVATLTAAGSADTTIRLSRRELARLRRALRHHHRITATVYGVTVRSRRIISSQTAGRRLRIRPTG